MQMNKLVIALIALAIVAISIIAFAGYANLMVNKGFEADDLASPDPTVITRSLGQAPTPATVVPQTADWGVSWEIPEDGVYSDFGGILWLTLRNYDSKDIWVYGMSFKWTDTETTYSRDTGVLAMANEDTLVGILPFGASLEPGTHSYELSLEIAVQSHSGAWYDWGVRSLSGTNHIEVLSTYPSSNWSTDANPTYYYDKLNERLDGEAVSAVIAQIQEEHPGEYNILQICEAYEWVHSHVEYVSDAGDYWQSAEETMSSLTGDCEDQAILMATIVKGLGGNARLNIISGHAFPTVFVTENESGLTAVEASIDSYYWTPSGSLRINYLNDELGYWLVIDTAGEPYVGGLPALSRYASTDSAAGNWSFSSSSFLITVDATGRTSAAPDLF
jgi:hypothetical protein